MKEKLACPVCLKSKLRLRQINLDCAVYLCRDKECKYPEGHKWRFVTRTLQELNKYKKKRVMKKILSKDNMDCGNERNTQESFNIDDLIEDQINKLQNNSGCNDDDLFENLTSLFENAKNSDTSINMEQTEYDININKLGSSEGTELNRTSGNNEGMPLNTSNINLDTTYIENLLSNDMSVSDGIIYENAVGFCDKFDFSGLSELLDTETPTINVSPEKSVGMSVSVDTCTIKISEKAERTNLSQVQILIANSCRNNVTKSNQSSKPLILNHYVFNKKT